DGCSSARPGGWVGAGPRWCLARAAAAALASRREAVEPLLIDAERAFTASGDEPHEPSVGRTLSVLANVPAAIAFLRADVARLRGDAARAVACDRQALAHLGKEDWLLRSLITWHLAAAGLL